MTKSSILKKCPVCNDELLITKLSCKKCNIELTGEFQCGEFTDLNLDETDFLKEFIRCEGNFSKIQLELNVSNAKERLKDIAVKLGLKKAYDEVDSNVLEKINIDKEQNMITKILKEKLSQNNGVAYMGMLKGDDMKIWLSNDGNGIIADGLKNVVLTWQVFDAIIKKANSLGGKMFRGDSAAQSGKRIGSEDLSVDSIDGFISLNFYGSSVGNTTLRRSTYYAGILSWAGIVDNLRANGEGGFIVVKPAYRNII